MNSDDLDKILLSEKQIEPSSSFLADVMVRVRDEASYDPRIPFPWMRFAAVTLVAAILTIWIFPAEPVLRAMHSLSYAIGKWMITLPDMALRDALLSASASLLGTLLLVWLSLGLTGARR
jgi:hypothetical protein